MTPSDILRQRGIYGACQDAGWQEHVFNGQAGWAYPLYKASGQVYDAKRWKNADSGGTPKYAWLPKKPDLVRYYLPPETLASIKAAWGKVYIASGEPDVMAFRAAGIKNSLCWFGESSTPETLADDMDKLGVKLICIYPDRDDTGMKWAHTIRERLEGSGIELMCMALPAEVGTKYDINKLWIDCAFDAAEFNRRLNVCKGIDADELALYAHADHKPASPSVTSALTESKELPPRFVDAILADVQSRLAHGKWSGDGWSENFKCVNPAHQDSTPSAGYNRLSHSYRCFACQSEGVGAKQYGEWIGVFLKDYYDAPAAAPAAKSSTGAPVSAPPVKSVITFTNSAAAIEELIKQIAGDSIITDEPMEYPFGVMHQFGGFAHMMQTGKLVYVSGISGGGKTAYGECFIEPALKGGTDVVVFNPEWSAVEMIVRALQRNGGMPMSAIQALRLWYYDFQHGIPEKARRGRLPIEEMRRGSISILQTMLKWRGLTHFVDAGTYDLSQLLDATEAHIEALRTNGRNPKTLVFDYLQRAPKTGNQDWNWGERVVTAVKSLCERERLFGIVFIQPTKGDSRATRTGAALTEGSGQGISDQQANLYVAISPVFSAVGGRAGFSRVDVLKNSMGRTGHLFQSHDLSKLKWHDAEVSETGDPITAESS